MQQEEPALQQRFSLWGLETSFRLLVGVTEITLRAQGPAVYSSPPCVLIGAPEGPGDPTPHCPLPTGPDKFSALSCSSDATAGSLQCAA